MLDLLRKLGILRYGVKTGKYTSAKDMPTEFLMNDVSNAEKDLVNKQDVEKVRASLKTSKGKKTLKWIILGIVGFIGVCFVLGALFGTDGTPSGQTSPAMQTQAVSPQVAVAPTQERQLPPASMTVDDEINAVFARVSEANRTENIDEFMKYYADAFPDRSGKRQKTLETWQQYDFVSLNFFVFDLDVQGERAQAKVGWEIALLEKDKQQPRLLETTNDVVLEKGGQGWQIVSLQ